MEQTLETIERIIGVYHAQGTALGELTYWLKARTGGAHCALCDITHGAVREKREWRRCRAEVPVPVETVHLDERDAGLEAFTEGRTPCVVAATPGGYVMLVDSSDLIDCDGSPSCLVDSITAHAADLGLQLG